MLRKLVTMAALFALYSCGQAPAYAQPVPPMCRPIADTAAFITEAAREVAAVHGFALEGAHAVAFARDSKADVEFLAVFVMPDGDGDMLLLVVFDMPGKGTGAACMSAPDEDDRAAIKRHFGTVS